MNGWCAVWQLASCQLVGCYSRVWPINFAQSNNCTRLPACTVSRSLPLINTIFHSCPLPPAPKKKLIARQASTCQLSIGLDGPRRRREGAVIIEPANWPVPTRLLVSALSLSQPVVGQQDARPTARVQFSLNLDFLNERAPPEEGEEAEARAHANWPPEAKERL